jgi:hypothetical protein
MSYSNIVRRPFEEDGTFYAGHVKHRGYGGKVVKRRCLCFALAASSVVGASVNFSRAEAYHTAVRANDGTLPALPAPHADTPRSHIISAILQMRGFPINSFTDPTVEIDETTAIALGKEFAR